MTRKQTLVTGHVEKPHAEIVSLATLLTVHPRPWRIHPDYPRTGFAADCDGVVLDANDKIVLGCSEWFHAGEGVLEQIIDLVNAAVLRP